MDFAELPDEIFLEILKKIELSDVIAVARVSKTWNAVCDSNEVWIEFVKRDFGDFTVDDSESSAKAIYQRMMHRVTFPSPCTNGMYSVSENGLTVRKIDQEMIIGGLLANPLPDTQKFGFAVHVDDVHPEKLKHIVDNRTNFQLNNYKDDWDMGIISVPAAPVWLRCVSNLLVMTHQKYFTLHDTVVFLIDRTVPCIHIALRNGPLINYVKLDSKYKDAQKCPLYFSVAMRGIGSQFTMTHTIASDYRTFTPKEYAVLKASGYMG